jgi:hypothetical protein
MVKFISAVVFAEVVLSPSSPEALENSSFTFTCTYTGDETVSLFVWKRVKTSEKIYSNLGLINASCYPLIIPVDSNLYGYSCPRSNQYTWTIKKVTKQNEGDKYQCDVDTPSPGMINSNEAIIYIQGTSILTHLKCLFHKLLSAWYKTFDLKLLNIDSFAIIVFFAVS